MANSELEGLYFIDGLVWAGETTRDYARGTRRGIQGLFRGRM